MTKVKSSDVDRLYRLWKETEKWYKIREPKNPENEFLTPEEQRSFSLIMINFQRLHDSLQNVVIGKERI